MTRRLFGFSLVLTALAGCSRPPATPAPAAAKTAESTIVELSAEGMETAGIRIARLSPQAFSPKLVVPAAIEADPSRVARVGARVAGRVTAVHVRLGDQVMAGKPLLDVDTVELHQVSKEFLTAVARARQARATLARQKQLVGERVGAPQELQRAEADEAAATADLNEAQEHLRFLGLDAGTVGRLKDGTGRGAERSVVRAPIAGRVVALGVVLGQVLAGTEELLTLARTDAVVATLRVSERDVAKVAQGVAVEITVPGYPEPFPGQLTFVGALVDPQSRTFEARAALANKDDRLRPGMSATAAVALPEGKAGLWLPAAAVQRHGGGKVAFVKIGERRFEARRLTADDEQGGMVLVRGGLVEGAEVVVAGAFALRGELERGELEGD